jgi:hypothetical protein
MPWVSQDEFPSSTDSALSRTYYLGVIEREVDQVLREYFEANNNGEDYTLAVFEDLGEQRVNQLQNQFGKSFDQIKKDIGLFVPQCLASLFPSPKFTVFTERYNDRKTSHARENLSRNSRSWLTSYTRHRVQNNQKNNTAATSLTRNDLTPKAEQNRSTFVTTYAPSNYEAKVNFTTMIELCHKHGDAIIIGFSGGVSEFLSRSNSSLLQRMYKWDWVSSGTGYKDLKNWISGSNLLEIIRQKFGFAVQPTPPNTYPSVQRKTDCHQAKVHSRFNHNYRDDLVNYKGKLDFASMIDLCQQHGDDIIIGFKGGISEFRSRSNSSLEQREYKWDWVEGGTGIKDRSNWIPGTIILKLVAEKFGNK